ncbi:hypothetical protein [Serinicoccus profundi]|uniref:hypothetical protein n=1 Tax=Serinicoccus profundi TaxID=1078471 RepID=UPI000255EB52|nr:hypothetical protein [Serinicoccus profundi]
MSIPTTGPAELRFTDGETLADLATYVRRATRLDADGAIRLQAVGAVLAAWVCVLPGSGLMRSGLTLGLRTMRLVEGHSPVDATVALAALGDRFARRAATGDATAQLPVPPQEVTAPWAGFTAPRGEWEPAGTVLVTDLVQAARAGIEEVAVGAPEGSGSAAVGALRSRVWGRTVGQSQVPAAAGLAVHTLGFAGPDRPGGAEGAVATVHRSGPWLRVSTAAGHVLVRP